MNLLFKEIASASVDGFHGVPSFRALFNNNQHFNLGGIRTLQVVVEYQTL
jgi:hypothetical protein